MAPFTLESPRPNAVEAALLRGLEQQNNALQTHVAWLSAELARASADEASAREDLAVATARLDPSSTVSLQEVKDLQQRVKELGDALSTRDARIHAAESRASALQSLLAKRDEQVVQLGLQLGRAAAHMKEQARAVAGWSERQPPSSQPMPSDLAAAKFTMQQRLIAELTQQLDEARRKMAGVQGASEIWEARHMMWEQMVEARAAAPPPQRNGSGLFSQRRVGEDGGSALRSEQSLLEAERAWQERCELQRRREAAS